MASGTPMLARLKLLKLEMSHSTNVAVNPRGNIILHQCQTLKPSTALLASASFLHPHRSPQAAAMLTLLLKYSRTRHVQPRAGFVPLTDLRLTSRRLGSHSVDFVSLRSPRHHLEEYLVLSLEQDSLLPDGHAGA